MVSRLEFVVEAGRIYTCEEKNPRFSQHLDSMSSTRTTTTSISNSHSTTSSHDEEHQCHHHVFGQKSKKHHLNQALAALAVSFGPFAVGLSKGYTSPALASMQVDNNNATGIGHVSISSFYISEQQGSWIASLSLLGALFGGLFAGLVIKQGRRSTLALISLPFAASWLLTTFATCVEMIYSTAFIVGVFSAIIQIAAQVYISEIAHPSIRGSLCSASKVFSHLGLLTSFILGAFLDWRQLACVCAGAPLMLFITVRFVPETPSYLLYTNQEEKAESSLFWLRGSSCDITDELTNISANIRRSREQSVTCHKVLVPQLLKPLLMTCGLMFFHRFSGVAAFNFYAVTIFEDAFSGGANPHLAAVTTSLVQLLSSVLSGVLSDVIGRLPLLVLSTALMAFALAAFGFFAYFQVHNDPLVASGDLDWIPLLCVVMFVCAFSLGLNPISWLLVGEVFSLEYRNIGPSIVTAFSYICAFIGVKTFVDMRQAWGLHGTFWTYSIVATVGLLYCAMVVPETKGRTLDEMRPASEEFLNENDVTTRDAKT